ncbi:GNAT family N-acetyltransferase [Selenomonas sp. F0473]|uniref:GNAT family N-acetyltransferase n=1 Tax=Selenomonas sp. F0473 TaxID=999423 RepID=UPI001E3A53FB|nr:GNAT family N-acetyltransferase [Selenomonas sp. F0473]
MTEKRRAVKTIDTLFLREATMEDAALLFEWRNDGTSREIRSKRIDASTHLLWLEETLRDPGVKFFILMRGATPIGRIRINRRDEGLVISCSIAADYRRRGYGARMLALLEDRVRAHRERRVLVAYVQKDNEASRRTFAKLGYQCMEEYESYRYTKQL